MRSLLGVLIALSAVLSPTAAPAADAASGQYWFKICENSATREGCIGYLSGLIHMELYASQRMPDGPLWCAPDDASVNDMMRTFVRFLEDRPELLHGSAVQLAHLAWARAYPCKRD